MVTQQFHRRSAQTEQDLGPKSGVDGEPDDCLHCVVNHRLDDSADHCGSQRSSHGLEGLPHLAFRPEVKPNRANLSFVDQVRTECLHYDRQANRRGSHSLVNIGH